jgi:hypothetical protein
MPYFIEYRKVIYNGRCNKCKQWSHHEVDYCGLSCGVSGCTCGGLTRYYLLPLSHEIDYDTLFDEFEAERLRWVESIKKGPLGGGLEG